MTKNKNSNEDNKDLADLIFSALFSGAQLNNDDFLDTLFLDEDGVDDAFRKKEDFPTAKEVEESLSKISDLNPYKDMMSNSFKGIINHENEKSRKEMVNHPDHYNKTEIETIEKFILINNDRPDKIKGALEFNIIKYSDRVGKKDSTSRGIKEDNDKIKFYMDVYELLFPESIEDINRYRIWKDSKK